jgi:hypothetical protein
MRLTILAAIALCAPTVALATPETILAEAAAACTEQDGGTFGSEGAVREVDLNGDGTLDTVVDEALFTCTTAASLYGGSGGSMVHFLVGEVEETRLAQGWDTADWSGLPLVLVALHGTECGGVGSDPCVEAMVWRDGRFHSVRPQAE